MVGDRPMTPAERQARSRSVLRWQLEETARRIDLLTAFIKGFVDEGIKDFSDEECERILDYLEVCYSALWEEPQDDE